MLNNFIVDRRFAVNNSIPSTYSESMSYFEDLAKLTTYVNQLYDQYVIEYGETKEMKDKYAGFIAELLGFQNELDKFKSGQLIPDGSINLVKMAADFFNDINDYIKKYMYDMHNFVSFGLEDGHFIAYIPKTWKDITFDTDVDGHLILEF